VLIVIKEFYKPAETWVAIGLDAADSSVR